MNKLAPRQGVFAVILLASFCLQVIALTVSNTKVLRGYQLDKGNQIASQLMQDAQMALASKDRISLAILINRYQVDSDVAQLTVKDNQQNILLQTGQTQAKTGAVIAKSVRDNNQEIGQFIVTMKGVATGEIIGNHWLFIVLSAVIHVFLWLLYGYVARPTDEDLRWIGERVQEKMAISQSTLLKTQQATDKVNVATSNIDVNQYLSSAEQNASDIIAAISPQQSISEYLQTQQNLSQPEPKNDIVADNTTEADVNLSNNVLLMDSNQTEIQFRFYDAYNLMDKVAPEVATPYLHLCEQLLKRACDELFRQTKHTSALVQQQLQGISISNHPYFTKNGAVVELSGEPEQLVFASVILGKLFIILNQVVYEKHRELTRFALPIYVGASAGKQFHEVQRLMSNYAKENSLLILFAENMRKPVAQHIKFRHQINPTSVSEREMLWYDGLIEEVMKDLIEKRDKILSTAENIG